MGRSPGGHNRVWVTEHAPQAHTNDSSGCRLHPLKWSWSTLRIPSQLLKRLYDLKACRLSQQREISTVVSILKHSCKRKGSLLSDSSTLLEPSYHWYLLCQKCWVGAKKTTCSEYLTPQTQIPTLISSWKANRCLEYVMSETELIISTPLILKSYYKYQFSQIPSTFPKKSFTRNQYNVTIYKMHVFYVWCLIYFLKTALRWRND